MKWAFEMRKGGKGIRKMCLMVLFNPLVKQKNIGF